MGSESSAPPTIFVVHRRENRRKCSIEPLRGQPGCCFWDYPLDTAPRLPAGADYVRLALTGPLLGRADAHCGLILLDATWRLAARMERDFAAIPARRLPIWLTAYPRISKWHAEPPHGLATLEALFAAHVILGRPTAGLLDAYHWKDEFLKLNQEQCAAG